LDFVETFNKESYKCGELDSVTKIKIDSTNSEDDEINDKNFKIDE